MSSNEKTLKPRRSFIDWFLNSNGATSVAVVLLGFLVAIILVALVGKKPGNLLRSLLISMVGQKNNRGVWNFRYVGETLAYSVPFVLTGLTMAFACRVGLFNIGGEGQYVVGMTVAQAFALLVKPFPGMWIACLLLATLCGALWGGLVGVLKAKYQVSEVVATIMLNYVALYGSRLISLNLPGANTYKTGPLPSQALLQKFLIPTSNLNIAFFIMIFACVVYWFIMEKTRLGFGFRATGLNKEAARCSGINVVKNIGLAMAISGAFSGLAGACVLLGGAFTSGRVLSAQDGYGFMGIAVALVGNNTAVGTFIAGILFGILKEAQSIMQTMDIPKEITYIIQGLIVVFIALRSGLELIKQQRAKARVRKEASK
ncbi:MAG: ABC transporter permease [Spirochaetales bacterium]|nr:ABC transporter permease [Spirochaetales bacterium]